jgi:competence protein ComEA
MLRTQRSRGALLCAAVLWTIASVSGAYADADPPVGVVVNLNTASLEELQYLPGVGETRARAILAARQARGGFKTVDELVEVKGIGPASLERLRPHVRVSGKTRVPETSSRR